MCGAIYFNVRYEYDQLVRLSKSSPGRMLGSSGNLYHQELGQTHTEGGGGGGGRGGGGGGGGGAVGGGREGVSNGKKELNALPLTMLSLT